MADSKKESVQQAHNEGQADGANNTYNNKYKRWSNWNVEKIDNYDKGYENGKSTKK